MARKWHGLIREGSPPNEDALQMTATIVQSHAFQRTAFSRMRKPSTATLVGLGLALPALCFLAAFLLIPAVRLIASGFLTQDARGALRGPVTLSHYLHFFDTSLYSHVLIVTLRISLLTAALAAVLGYPVALVMVRSHPTITRVVTFITIAPLIVSVVVRSYGWQLILGNGPAGLLNWILLSLGVINTPLRLLYSETAVVIGSLHVFLPMMVLPLASALGKIEPRLEEAARTLGMPAWRVFHRITLPLSLPGLAVGFTLVFSLTAGSFVTPAMLGGTNAQMLGNLIDQQITAIYDWPFGATIATVLVAIVVSVNLVSMRLLDGKRRASA
jgi:putative spermidine/putrescine transport system permease protein